MGKPEFFRQLFCLVIGAREGSEELLPLPRWKTELVMIDKLEAINDRYQYLQEQMADPEVISDMDRYTAIGKEYKDLEEVVKAYLEYKDILGNIATSKEMLNEPDPDMQEMAKAELEELEPAKEALEEKIKVLLIPKDPEDSKDVIFEIRSGTGGDEASIFAGDLYRLYSKFFENQGWKTEIVSVNEGTVGGYNKIVLEVSGKEVFGKLKFESGAHRVQRVPKTESQGRVHTSAATVAVIPKLEMEDVNINKADLKVDTFRSSGAGGQHVNKTESGVRFTHLPTGIVAESTDGRSQIKNREIAITRLYQKIYEAQREAHDSKMAAKRRSLVGSGDRSGKIRTYNYPQNRVTDHRINLTLYNLDKIMEGQIDEIIEALQVEENAEKMRAAEDQI
jgi:peptide chain release factor 1